MDLQIYIPTLGRVHRQVTFTRLPESLQKHVKLVVAPDEVAAHRAQGMESSNLLPCKAQGTGIGPVRDWILDHARKNGYKRFCMVDDDIILQKRRDEDGLKTSEAGRRYYRITNASPEEYIAAFKWVDGALKKHAHASWGTRFLDLEVPDTEIYGGRALGLLGYNVDMVTKAKARFMKGLEGTRGGMEDNNMTLQLLKVGLPNAISMVWRASPYGSNTSGGCSIWRNAKSIEEQARRIVKAHAPFAKMREKKTKWEGVAGTQWDVQIQWQKALKSGGAQ